MGRKPNHRTQIIQLLHDDVDPEKFFYPRPYRSKAPSFFWDPKRLKQPLTALHGLARFSEELMRRVRFGPLTQRCHFDAVAKLYTSVRDAITHEIQNCKVSGYTSPRRKASLQKRVVLLQNLAETTYKSMSVTKYRQCPCCRGAGRIQEDFAKDIVIALMQLEDKQEAELLRAHENSRIAMREAAKEQADEPDEGELVELEGSDEEELEELDELSEEN